MSDFSEYLNSYMEENSINSAQLSRETDIERTVIYKWRKGNRVPANEEIVMHIADALRMTVVEKQTLIDKYERLSMGELVVNSYHYIKNLLSKLKNTNIKSNSMTLKWDMSLKSELELNIVHLNSKEEIVSCITNLFRLIIEKEDKIKTLRLMMQPRYETIQERIQSFFRGSSIRIEQIVCLEQSYQKSYKNLQIFQWVLPLCFEQLNYEVLYYYDFLSHHINTMSWMPNILIIGDHVVQFDYEMEQGIAVKDAQYTETMIAEFDRIKKKALPFLTSGDNQMGAMDIYSEIGAELPSTIFEQPCLGVGISTEIYEEFLYPFPEKEEFMKAMALQNGDWEGDTFLPPKQKSQMEIKSYCSKRGIREFMETGRVNEFPNGFYRPLDMDTRKKVLRRIIYLIREGGISYYFLPDEIELPSHIYFYLDGVNKQITLNRIHEDSVSRVCVKEPSIYKAFQCFFEYLEKKGMLSGREEVLRELEEVRKEYW